MKKILMCSFIFIASICCLSASVVDTSFTLLFHKASSSSVEFFKDEACTNPLDEITFNFPASSAILSITDFYVRWRVLEESSVQISLVAASKSGIPADEDDFCLRYQENPNIGLNYDIYVTGIGAISSVSGGFSLNSVEQDILLPLARRTTPVIYTTTAGTFDENVVKVHLVAHAPKEGGEGTNNAFLEGTQVGYFFVKLTVV